MPLRMPRFVPAGGAARTAMIVGACVAAPAIVVGSLVLFGHNQPDRPAPSEAGDLPPSRGDVAGPIDSERLEALRRQDDARKAADARRSGMSYTPDMGGFGEKEAYREPGDVGPQPATGGGAGVTLVQPVAPRQADAPPRIFTDMDIGAALALAQKAMTGAGGRPPTVNAYDSGLGRAGPRAGEARLEGAQAGPGAVQQVAAATSAAQRPKRVLMEAGTGVLGTIVVGGNTDQGSPTIIAEALSGPIKGKRLLGSFARQGQSNQPGALLNLRFTQMQVGGGRMAAIDAYAVAPDTMDSAVASRIDPHTTERIVLPMLAAGIQGMGQALAFSGSTVGATGFGGGFSAFRQFSPEQIAGIAAGSAAASASEQLRQQAPRERTVYIDAGAEVGIVFRAPLTAED